MFVTFIELIAIFVIGQSIRAILQTDAFKKKMAKVNAKKDADQNEESGKNTSGVVTGILALGLMLLAPDVAQAGILENYPFDYTPQNSTLYIILAFDILLLGVLFYFVKLTKTLLNIDKSEEELKAAVKPAPSIDIMHILTDSVPVEEEEKVATDHEYDGIRELDNNLPPWWKWGFYVSIVFAVVYLINYHVLKIGDLQEEAYLKEMAEADERVQAYLASQAMNVDEFSVTVMTEESDLNSGKAIFMRYCKVCHAEDGGGLVGPNFTDDYWLYGNKINDLFKTIKYGAKNGMKSWKDELNPIQMQQVASYIKTLHGTTPAKPKEAQGDFYPADSDTDNPSETEEGETTEDVSNTETALAN